MKFKYLNIFRSSDEDLLYSEIPSQLLSLGYKLHEGHTYLYAPGKIPVCLIAHIDTVFERKVKSIPEIFFDRKKGVLWSPDGLGGDDRAGVSAILEILKRGYRPHVLFLDYEESGCIGARDAAKEIKTPDLKYVIELDRRGFNDACYYDLDNLKFERYVQSFGFEYADGIYTDICHICPAWGIAGVNLSIGYYNAHTREEYLRVDQWEATVDKVCNMLNNVPKKKFCYHSKPRANGYWWNGKFYSYTYYNYNDDYAYDYNRKYKDTGLSDYDRARILSICNGYEENEEYQYGSYSDYIRAKCGFSRESSVSNSKTAGLNSLADESTEYDLGVLVTAEDLYIMYGGSVEGWNRWLKKNVEEIERAAQNKVFEVIDKMIIDDYSNVYETILTAGTNMREI